MTGRRRGRTGRGWDAAPPLARATGSRQGSERDPRANGPASTLETHAETEQADPAERAREICLRHLAIRPRTKAELASAMRRSGVPAEIAAEVLARYGEVGIIDDKAFARAWVTSRHHGRGLARRALAAELRRKGLDGEAVDAGLDELDLDTEAETARALVDRRLRADRGGPTKALVRRLLGMLARKGYPAGLAIRVVKEALAEREQDVDLDAAELEAFEDSAEDSGEVASSSV